MNRMYTCIFVYINIYACMKVYAILLLEIIRTRRISRYPLAAMRVTSCYRRTKGCLCSGVLYLHSSPYRILYGKGFIMYDVVVTVVSIVFFTYGAQQQRWYPLRVRHGNTQPARGNYKLHMGRPAPAEEQKMFKTYLSNSFNEQT